MAAGEGSIERVPAEDAMLRANRNALRRYPAPGRDGDRLYPLASPSVTPGFRIAPTDTVFAIGSCFARNVEKALETAGLRVLSRGFDLGEIGDRLEDATNFFNKYSIHSVTNEVRWALDRESFPGEAIFYPAGPDRYLDLQLGVGRLDFPLDTILAFRHRYLDALAAVAHADVVILTLGYVETWFDRTLGLYLNVAPPAPLIRDQPGRFEFVVLSYNDVLAGLEAFHALLLRHRTRPLADARHRLARAAPLHLPRRRRPRGQRLLEVRPARGARGIREGQGGRRLLPVLRIRGALEPRGRMGAERLPAREPGRDQPHHGQRAHELHGRGRRHRRPQQAKARPRSPARRSSRRSA